MAFYGSRNAPRGRVPLLGLLTTACVVAVLVGAVEASAQLSGGSHIAAGTTTRTQTTTPTTLSFSFSEKSHRALANGRELTSSSGSGTLTLAARPQEPNTAYASTSATGTIKFHRWKVVGHRVIDEDDFTMTVTAGQYRFRNVAASLGVQGTVTRAASKTTDLCSAGSPGGFGLGQGKVKGRPDFVGLEMCGVRLGYTNAINGVRARVTIKIQPTH